MMPLLISLEAKIDNSGHGEMVSVGFIHANISDLAWMSKAKLYVVRKKLKYSKTPK